MCAIVRRLPRVDAHLLEGVDHARRRVHLHKVPERAAKGGGIPVDHSVGACDAMDCGHGRERGAAECILETQSVGDQMCGEAAAGEVDVKQAFAILRIDGRGIVTRR